MATLQTARQSTAYTARSRLQQVIREYPSEVHPHSASPQTHGDKMERVEESIPAAFSAPSSDHALAGSYRYRLSELDQHHILLNAVGIYPGWYLVSIQRRPENDALVAHLVREADQNDAAAAIREGRTLQIIMDVTGDMKVQYGRRRQGWLAHVLSRLISLQE